MKILLTGFVLAALSFQVIAQTPGQIDITKVPHPLPHYEPEYTYDISVNNSAWDRLEHGLKAAFGSTDMLYLRKEVPSGELQTLEATGWKGERINAQLLIWSLDTARQVRVRTSNLSSSGGKSISRDNITTNLVRYVVSNYRYNASGFGCDAPADSAWLMPDRFEKFDRFDLPGRTLRPVWISFNIPATAEAGEYNGTIEISSETETLTKNVKITVQKQLLPSPHNWKFRLDLWQNPWVVASYYNVEPWSKEHKELLKKHLRLYADAGGKFITTYAVESPWSDNSYTTEGNMISWTRTRANNWKFDYSIFDQYVELSMAEGIDGAITIYTPVPWGHRFRFLDEKTGNFVDEAWSPDSEKFKTIWNLFLNDLKAHLIKKGWFDRTYLGINENPMEMTLAAAKVIKENSKDWKITYAGDWHKELASLLDDYSLVITSEPTGEELRSRTEKGLTTTFYVCCNPPKPNNFIFSPPVEGRYISWYALSRGYNGFLRWAYDAWTADPLRDARHVYWPSGDCFLVYPGGNSCIRFEKLREGISDYEKVNILRKLVSSSQNKKAKSLMAELEAHLASFDTSNDYTKRDVSTARIAGDVEKGLKLINVLSVELGK